MAVQWPFADFLMSPAARNWFFGAKYFGYYVLAHFALRALSVLSPPSTGARFWREWRLRLAIAILTTRFGLAAGDWMRRIQTMRCAATITVLPCSSAAAAPLAAHVGSPDIFFEGDAGPYQLLVTIRPPQVVPGVAEIEIRSLSADVREIHMCRCA